MSAKVKRGLGLLAVAPLGLIAVLLGRWMIDSGYGLGETVALAGFVALAVGVVGGFFNIAVGLLSSD